MIISLTKTQVLQVFPISFGQYFDSFWTQITMFYIKTYAT